MKSKMYKGLIALIAMIAANVGVFLLVKHFTPLFWINYSFAMIACILTIFINIFSLDKEKPIFGYTLAAVSWAYLIVELIVAFVFSKLLPFFILPAFLIQLFILAAFGICYLQVKMVNESIKDRQAVRGNEILNFKYILEKMKEVQRKIAYSESYRKTVEHVYDSLASGQTKSNDMAGEVERAILGKISELDAAVEKHADEEVLAVCREIERLSEERKRILTLKQNF